MAKKVDLETALRFMDAAKKKAQQISVPMDIVVVNGLRLSSVTFGNKIVFEGQGHKSNIYHVSAHPNSN